MAILRKNAKKPAPKKPAKKKPAKKPKPKKGVNPGGTDITPTGSSPASTTPPSSVVASQDMSSSPDYGTVTGTSAQSQGNAPDTSDAIFSTGAGYAPHYHGAQPAAEEYALATQQTQTSEVSPI